MLHLRKTHGQPIGETEMLDRENLRRAIRMVLCVQVRLFVGRRRDDVVGGVGQRLRLGLAIVRLGACAKVWGLGFRV